MLTFDEAYSAATSHGWLSYDEARLVWDQIMRLECCRFLEIGVYYGRSAGIIAAAMAGVERSSKRLVLCDPFEDGHHFCEAKEPGKKQEALKSIWREIERAGSDMIAATDLREMTDQDYFKHISIDRHAKFDIVYYDGDHSYEATARGIRQWSTRITMGGIMLIHDYALDGGGREIKRAIDDSGLRLLKVVGTMAMLDPHQYAEVPK